MGLQKIPQFKDTKSGKEWDKEFKTLWNTFCKTGSMCITNILGKTDNPDIKEIIKKDPAALTRAHCDYNSYDGTSYADFVKNIKRLEVF